MKNAPCRDCPERGCGKKHDSCKAFLEWKADREQEKQRQREQSKIQGEIIESVLRIRKKVNK